MGPRVLVIGGGAIGGVLAARLASHGHSITVLDTNAEHVERMRDPGLSVEMIDRVLVTQIDAVSSSTDLQGTYDFGLITLKAPFIQSALELLVKAKRIKSYVSLGNGLVQDLIRDVVGDEQVIVGLSPGSYPSSPWAHPPNHSGANRARDIARQQLNGYRAARQDSCKRSGG